MRYVLDNDMHIHSGLSLCSKDPEQTPERILQYAKDNGITTLVLTDHYWDESIPDVTNFYTVQNFPWICQAKPLPQCEGIRFLFGAETDIDKNMRLGLPKEKFDDFDFVVIPTTHLHMKNFTITEEDASTVEGRAKVWIKKLEALLNMDIPFHKVGIAHLTCGLIAPTREEYLQVLDLLPTEKLTELFTKCANLGAGIELNSYDMKFKEEEADTVLRIYRIAKSCGCKFYMGSDAHHPEALDYAPTSFNRAIDVLGLTEDDKFILKNN